MRKVTGLLAHLVLIGYCCFSLYPLVWVWVTALRPTREIYRNTFGFPSSLDFGNIVKAWTTGRFAQYSLNSLVVTVATVLIVLFLSSLAAYSLARLKLPGGNAFFYLFLVGLMLPAQMIMLPLYYLLRDLGILSTYLALILPYIAAAQPFGIFFMRGFFRGVPQDLIDSARIDGCGEYAIYWRIMLPLAGPALGSLAAFQSLWTWNEFIFALVFIQTDKLKTVPLGLMHFQDRYAMDIGGIAGAATIATVPIILVYLVLQRQFIQGITAGAVK